MSKYTTGELAKLCGVTVRTVQYYDSRGILVPSDLSEGGRRLYSEEDLHKLRTICFLRGMGVSIQSIGELYQEEDPGRVNDVMLEEQSRTLQAEISQRQGQLDQLEALRKELRGIDHCNVESLGDIAYHLDNIKKRHRMQIPLILVGLVANGMEWGSMIWGILARNWWPWIIGFSLGMSVEFLCVWYYMKWTAYICPHCHTVFRPPFKECLLARHTRATRKLTCTHCGHHGFCVETYHRRAEASQKKVDSLEA